MTADEPGLESQLRAAGRGGGLEKAMAFAAVRNSLVGNALELEGDLGKYRVLERLGAGGMGAVFAAWDPELERRVAIKVLVGDAEASAEQKLIMREAKAAAQLSHPNVVTVFEVGMAQGRVFLAMEYIRGQTLRAWVQSDPGAADRLAVLLQAGRGLAAAHERGLVHRDFKPDNVLVDTSLLAKVVDFGLAHSSAEALEAGADEARTEPGNATLTQTGSRSGTPHYMAPETLQGQPADARSDQFSFAVTAWEVLCGARPFERNDEAGEPRGRPIAGVSRGVVQALAKALQSDPARRHASITALLDAIDPAPRAARRTRWILAGAGALTAGALAWGLRPSAEAPALCFGAQDRLGGIWDDASRSTFEASFLAADPDAGAAAWANTVRALDAYAEAWTTASTEACEATRVRGEQSDETLTLRNRCLHDRLRSFRGLTERFETIDAAATGRAPAAAADLPSIETCADLGFLAALVEPPPPDLADAVEETHARLAALEAAEELGQYKEVAASTPPLLERASALGHRPLTAEVGFLQGRIHQRMGKYPQARAALERAVLDATASRHDQLLAKALNLLALVVGFDLGDADAGLAVSERAEAALVRIGGDPELDALLVSRRGLILLRAGELTGARARFEEAAEMFANSHPSGVQYGDMQTNLANISITLSEWDRASEELSRALEIFDRLHGPEHPAVGAVLGNRGIVLRNLGRLDDARADFTRAREIFVATHGKTHPRVAAIDLNLGNVELAADRPQAALQLLEGAVTQLTASLGEEHVWVAKALSSRGNARVETGDLDGGVADLEQAITTFDAASAGSVDLANARCYLGSARAKQGDAESANAAYDAALAVFRATLGDAYEDHPDVADCRTRRAAVPSPK